MFAFDYVRPRSPEEAVRLRRDRADGLFLAGGMTLIPVLKQRLAMPSVLIDLAGLEELHAISAEAGRVTVGALARHASVADSPLIQTQLPALARLAGSIGDPQVRNRGTIGGALANNDPVADYPAAILGFGATIRTDRRIIGADSFFTGLFATALEPDELITHVEIPVPEAAAYAKFEQPASHYALAGVMVARAADRVRVAVTGAGPGVFRVPAMEAALARSFTPEALDGIAIPAEDLNDDLHASAAYRAHLVVVLAKRAVAAALTPGPLQ